MKATSSPRKLVYLIGVCGVTLRNSFQFMGVPEGKPNQSVSNNEVLMWSEVILTYAQVCVAQARPRGSAHPVFWGRGPSAHDRAAWRPDRIPHGVSFFCAPACRQAFIALTGIHADTLQKARAIAIGAALPPLPAILVNEKGPEIRICTAFLFFGFGFLARNPQEAGDMSLKGVSRFRSMISGPS